MLKSFQDLSIIKKKILLIVGLVLSILLGSILGTFIGLVAVTFIPTCCSETGCHNCFEFRGMIGYEATAYIGFWSGFFVGPILYIILVKKLIKRGFLK
ncbi:MAG: hypothetical protein ACQEP3_00600 [Patescibacteria group bacterium]